MGKSKKIKGVVIFDTETETYYCRGGVWLKDIQDAKIIVGSQQLNKILTYLKGHVGYLGKYNIKYSNLICKNVILKVKD